MNTNIKQSGIENITYRSDTNNFRVRATIEGHRRSYGSYNSLLEATEALHTVLKYKNLIEGLK